MHMIDLTALRESLTNGEGLRAAIRRQLHEIKVTLGQLDPNGHCNAACWFCPVKYQGNPPEYDVQMDPIALNKVLTEIRSATVVDQAKFNFLYTAHYNEVLLYKHYGAMLNLLRHHKFQTMVLTNGTTLTPKNTDLLNDNRDVATSVCMNIPGIELEDWAEKAGMKPNVHRQLLKNLDYFCEHSQIPASVQINCATERSNGSLDGALTTTVAEAQSVADKFKARWPRFNVFLNEHLVDRAGNLAVVNVIRNRPQQTDNAVIACAHDLHMGSRIYAWLHINALGELFLCCDDYQMKYKFGSLLDDTLDNLWLSEKHVDVISTAFNEICRGCIHQVRY